MVRTRQHLGKYRVEKRLAEGGFAVVYRALDTIEGIPVALKIPHPHLVTRAALEDFRKEVRVTARLDHPNILPIKNAGFINDHFVIVYPLGEASLADRLKKRLSLRTALNYAEQMLEAVAFAHQKRIMHLDVKPDNLIIFSGDRLRLADFGIAKVAQRTIDASGAGTVGYIAPEQAMGKPSLRSDVFSLGLILYRMFSGHLPEWPFTWPPPGEEKLRRRLHPQFIGLIRRAIEVDHKERYADAGQMLTAFGRIKGRALRRPGRTATGRSRASSNGQNWKTVRVRDFTRRYRRALDVRSTCEHCGEPVGEAMATCPWCGTKREKHRDETQFPAQCPRCRRGVKLDWRFCPWCYGAAIGPLEEREYTDKRYSDRCTNPKCSRKQLMPFMRYCPWCRKKLKKKWPIPEVGSESGSHEKCRSCGWGILSEYWDYCPWCGKPITNR